jgi:hypothetical protein
MNARRIAALTLGLPQSSRTMRAIAGPDDQWPPDRTLLGLIVERLDALHATTVKAAGGKVRGALPEIVPRPKARPRAAQRASTSSILDDLDLALVGG